MNVEDLIIDNLDDDTLQRSARRAARNSTTLEEEARSILRAVLLNPSE